MKTILLIFIGFWVLTGCADKYGHEIHGGNLTVYFTEENDQKLAEDIAVYWKDNDLVATDLQAIQLFKIDDWYELRIIANRPNEVKQMKFEERVGLLSLQQDLQLELNEPNLQLVICNNRFEEIYNINE